MASVVVADAGPLLALAKLNLLHLLKSLYGRVEFTQSVYDEVVTCGMYRGYSDAHDLQRFFGLEGWEPIAVGSIPDALEGAKLDLGERDSIALAMTRSCPLLMDEERGREVARNMGVPVHGTLGVLVQALRAGYILKDQFQLYVNQIIDRPDIWISPELCRKILHEVLSESAKSR